MCNESLAGILAKRFLISGHLALSFCDDVIKLRVGLPLYVGGPQIAQLHAFSYRRVPAPIRSVAHYAFRFICRGGILFLARCNDAAGARGCPYERGYGQCDYG